MSRETENLAAIQNLIESIDKRKSNQNQNLKLAQRILSSSIGEVTNASTSASSDADDNNRARTRRSQSSLIQKIERTYRKRTAGRGKNNDIENKMKRVRELHQEMKNSGMDADLISDFLLLFSRLAGTGTGADGTGKSAGRTDGMNNAFAIPSYASSGREVPSRGNQTQNIHQSDKHVELALRNEETNLLRECIHALQYIDGDLIKFYHEEPSDESKMETYNPHDTDVDAERRSRALKAASMKKYNGIRIRPGLLPFHLDPENRVKHKSTRLMSSGGQDALRICGEAGWLYSRIQNYITAVQSQPESGVLPRALASALMQEMESYHAFLHSLETQIRSDGDACGLTARRLMKQLRGPTSHLRTLSMAVDGINADLRGGQLLLVLYLHSMHGDVRHTDIINRILYSASLPWYDMLYDWTMGGILTPGLNDDFFVVENNAVDDANLWHGRYLLRKEQIPHLPGIGTRGGLLSEQLAEDILVVGKGINFVRKCLHDSEWEFDIRGLLSRNSSDHMMEGEDGASQRIKQGKVELGFHYDANGDSSFDICGKGGEVMTSTSLEKTVSIVASQVHRHILSSLFEQYHLLEHLRGLKEILFLGQGDFICALMDGLETEFDSRESINEIHTISLMNIVHDAVRSTNAKFLPTYVTDRVQVRLLSAEDSGNKFWAGDNKDIEKEGWDIFTLDYDIEAPLTAIVHPEAMKKYHLVFDLLFRLKKVEWMMNNTWRQSTTLNHALQLMISKFGTVELGPSSVLKEENALSRMKRLLRKFSMTRQCMLHFLTNIQSYLMFEVLESGWKDLVNRLHRAKTLDEVITSHNEYLDDIIAKSLVGEASIMNGKDSDNGNGLPNQLRLVLTAIFRFCKMHDKIFSDGVETIQKATEKRRGAQRRSAHGKWGFETFDADVEGLNFYSLADEKRIVEVESISEDFDISLRNLLSMLNERINGNSVRDVDVSSPSLARSSQTVHSDRAVASKNDSLRFLTFRLDFSAYYS